MATTTTFEKFGVPLSLSVEKAVTSKTKKRAGFRYPLASDLGTTISGGLIHKPANQGKYFAPATGIALIRNNLRQLLLTQKGERVMLPDYGLDLFKYLFEPIDKTLFFLIKRDIATTINKYFSIASILSLRVFSEDSDRENNTIRVSLTLQLKDESLDMFDVEVTIG